jgi:hypothetical protein
VDVKGRFELEVTFAHPQKHSVSSVWHPTVAVDFGTWK